MAQLTWPFIFCYVYLHINSCLLYMITGLSILTHWPSDCHLTPYLWINISDLGCPLCLAKQHLRSVNSALRTAKPLVYGRWCTKWCSTCQQLKMTATPAWWILLFIRSHRTRRSSSILIYHLLLHQCHMMTMCLFQSHQQQMEPTWKCRIRRMSVKKREKLGNLVNLTFQNSRNSMI